MKHIIVPSDFSNNANNALNYAVNIANHFEACTLHLIHAYEVSGATGMMGAVKTFINSQTEQALSNIVKDIKSSLFHGTALVAKAIEGEPIDLIVKYAEHLKADYIIMGTQGASSLKEVFMGTNTLGVIKNSSIPVLAIPSEHKYEPIKNIVLAIDSNVVSTSGVVKPMTILAKEYQSKVNVLHVGKEKESATIDAGVDINLSELQHSFHFVQDKKIDKGINDFVEKEQAHLLCVIRRKRDFLSHFFHVSITQKEVFHSKIPLMILHDK